MNACDVFVKIGGSVLDHDAETTELVPHLTALAASHRILILTGGGQSAKRLKANQRAHGTHFYNCWRAGVFCLEVNANLLASYSKVFRLVSSLSDIAACFEDGHIAVLAPAGPIINSLQLTPDWNVTTDSMGLHFASLLGARRYVIVSDVHGIYDRPPEHGAAGAPISQLHVEELEQMSSSKLDPAFPLYFRRHPLPTIIVNGRYPSHVSAAIRGTPTVCTQILPRGEQAA